MGWTKRDIRVPAYPRGKGSAEQWVRAAYIRELATYHKKFRSYAFIAITDGDKLGVENRQKQIEQACKAANIKPRSDDDAVAIVVPTWSIETWIKYLDGEEINEQQKTVKKKKNESECYPAVERLLSICKTDGLPENAPNSLKAACAEFRTRIYR